MSEILFARLDEIVPLTLLGTSGHKIPYLDGDNTWSGTNTFAPLNNFALGISIQQTGSGGTPSAQVGTFLGYAYNRTKIDNRTAAGFTSSVFGQHVQLDSTVAGAGGANAAGFFHTVSGTASGGSGFAIGSTHYASVEANWLGGTFVSPSGSVYGISVYARMGGPNVLHLQNLTGMEINPEVGGAAGTTVKYKSGIQIALLQNDLYQGSTYDGAISLSNISGSTTLGWINGILFSDANGQHPISTTGSLLATQGSATVGTAIDISSYTMTTAMKSPGYNLSGGGAIVTTPPTGSGLIMNDGTVSAVFYPSALFTHSVAIGASTNHIVAFLQNNSVVSYIDTSKQFNIGATGITQGVANLRGLTSGAVSLGVQAAAGTYNFNLPITAGSAGQALTSQGGGATAMTWVTYLTGNQSITLSGDVSGTGATAITTVLTTAQPAVHTWALAQTFTVAPVFTDQSGSRTALGLGNVDNTSDTTKNAAAVTLTNKTITAPIINGVVSGAAAGVGVVGETLTASAALDSVSITSNTAVNITSISLTAGDWDITGTIHYLPAATTTEQYLEASIGSVSATRNLTVGAFTSLSLASIVPGSGGRTSITAPEQQVNISGTTTYYLVAYDTHGVSTMAAGGKITARRRR